MCVCVYIYISSSSSCCCLVGWDYRIHRLILCRGVRPTTNECPEYDTKLYDGEVPIMLELWGMKSTPSLPLFPRRLGQAELNCVLMLI